MRVPRDYQEWGNTALWNHIHDPETWNGDKVLNPLIVNATGLGKSLSIAMIVRMLLHYYPDTRIIQPTHVKELVESNFNELINFWPLAPAGIYSAGLGQRDTRAQVTFCSIQSVANRPATFGHIDFVIIDEAHTLSDNETASYSKFIAALREVNPRIMVIGFTATPFRMTSGMLTDGDNFDKIVYDVGSGESFVWAVEHGYLIRPVPKNPGFELDSDAIGIQAGDFKSKEASEAMHDQGILERAVKMSIEMGADRRAWLTFCQSIEDAELVADMFTHFGYPHEAVHSKRTDRDDIIEKFKRGELRGVTNRDILTTGFNHPGIDLINVLRLTRSPGLWVQMIGRGTRPLWTPGYDISTLEGRLESIAASPKQSCLVLDYCGNTRRLGPINYPNLPTRRGSGGGGDMSRECPECHTWNHLSRMTCEECGYEFPPPERIEDKYSDMDLVIASLPKPKPIVKTIETVHEMVCEYNHGREGKRDTLKVRYRCGLMTVNDWICFEHPEGTWPRDKAKRWWKQHGGLGEVPSTVEEALDKSDQLRKPIYIKVVHEKYRSVEAYDFTGNAFELPEELGGPGKREPDPDPVMPITSYSSTADYLDDDIPF